MTFNAGDIEATIRARRDQFQRDLDDARADADKWAAKPVTVSIKAEGAAAAKADLDKVAAARAALGDKDAVVKVTASTAGADGPMDKTAAKADALDAKAPVIKVTADTAGADAPMDRTAQKRDALGRFVSFKVTADTTEADIGLDKVEARKAAAGRPVTIPVRTRADTSGIDAATAKVVKFAGKLRDAGGPFWLGPALLTLGAIGTTAGVATGAAIGLAGAFTAGAGALAAFGAVAKPVLSGAQAAQVAVTAATSAYHATLAAGVPVAAAQQAQTAANAKAQSAYAIALAAGTKPATALLALHKSLATSQAAYSAATDKGTFSARALATEQAAITTAYAGMSPAQVALSRQLGDMAAGWKNLQAAETPVVAGAVLPWLQSVTSLTAALPPVISAVAPVIAYLGTQFSGLVNSQAFRDFRDFIAGTGTATVSAAGSTIIDLVKSFITLLPQFDPLIREAVNHIADLGPAVLKWSQSGQASADIQRFMQWFNDNGPKVGSFLGSIGGALKALAPGLTGSATGELQVLTGFFNLVAKLPPSFATPIAEIAGWLLLLNKFGVISVGVKVIGAAAGWVKKLLGGASVDVGAAGMQAAADTMAGAAAAMQAAADTMAGTDLAGTGAVGTLGTVGPARALEGDAIGSGIGGKLLSAGIVTAIAAAIALLVVKPLLQGQSSGTQQDSSKPGNWWDNPGGANPSDPRTAAQGFSTWAGAGTMIKDWLGFGQSSPSQATPNNRGAAPGPSASVIDPNTGELAWTKWWQDFDRDFVHKITDWFTVSLPHLFTSTIPHAADGPWNTLWANTITRTARGFHDVAGWFDTGRHDIAAKVEQIAGDIEDGLKAAWTWVVSNVATPIGAFFTRTLPGWFSASIGFLKSDFVSPLENAFKDAWTWLQASIGTPMATWLTRTLPGYFTSAVAAIGRAWDTIENKVMAPVDWVVTNVYDDLIVKFWNSVAGPVGLPKLAAFAEGGVVPGGYSRADNQLAWLRSGEGILQPGAVAALGGPAFIGWANRAYGDVPVSASGAGHYAGGGILPSPITAVGHAVSGVIGDIGGFLGGLASQVKAGIYDGLAAAGTSVIGAAARQVPGTNGVAEAMREYPVKLWDGFATWVSGHGPGPVAVGGGGGGIGLGGLSGSSGYAAFKSVAAKIGWGAAQLAAWVGVEMLEAGFSLTAQNPTSGAYGMAQFINGAGEYAQYGGNSGTYIGQAVAMANYILQRYGTPEAAYQHEISSHWYDNGGWLQPGATMVMNATGRPEPVLTGDQWDALTSAIAGGGTSQLAGTVNIMLPEGTSLTSALNELDFKLRAARLQGFLASP